MIVIHGLAEHLGVYDELGQRLAADNMLAFGHDHGESLEVFSLHFVFSPLLRRDAAEVILPFHARIRTQEACLIRLFPSRKKKVFSFFLSYGVHR